MSSSTRKDIELLVAGKNKTEGTTKYKVAASANLIYPGDPVAVTLGGYVVNAMATNKPVVGTDYLCGIAVSTSTNTPSADGYVDVMPIDNGDIWLITPKNPSSFDTQAKYDLLVGDRVVMDLTAGKYTLLNTDGAANGCVIMPLDVTKYPNKVAFSFRSGVSYLS
jgi:hypothetical protein